MLTIPGLAASGMAETTKGWMGMEGSIYLETMKQHIKTAYLLSDEKTATMIPVFLTTLQSHLDRLAELAADGDMHQLSRASHAVKGALLNIGLADLAQTAYAIEKQCRDGDRSFDYQAKVAELRTTVARFTKNC